MSEPTIDRHPVIQSSPHAKTLPPQNLDAPPPLRVALAFVLLAAIFYAPIVLGLRTFPDGDFTHHFLPFSLHLQRAMLELQLPLWNPYTYSGHPFLADTQAAVFYPISNLILALTLPWTEASARLYFLQIEAVLQVALAGFFVYLLMKELTGVWQAALLAGAIFALSGYLTGYPPVQLAILRTAIWLPLIFWLLLRAFAKPERWRYWIGTGLVAAVTIFAGHPQTLQFASYASVAWVGFLFGFAPGRPRSSLIGRRAAGLALAAAIALGLGAAQLLPSIEFTRWSVRAAVDYAFVSGGFPLQDSWQVLLPGVFTTYSPLYVGVVGLGLVALAIGQLPRSESELQPARLPARAAILFFLAMVIVALLLSYGDNAFLYPIFYRFAPGWDLFRGQERAAYLVAFSLSILAGYGAATIDSATLTRRRRVAIIYAGIVTAGVYAFGLLWQLPGRTAIGPVSYLVIAFFTLALAMAVALLLWLPGWSRRRWLILVALVVGNLFCANFVTNLDQFGPARKALLAPEMQALAAAVEEPGAAIQGLPGRVFNEHRIYEDYGMRQQIEDDWGSSPLRLARYAALFDEFPLDRLWRLTGVNHVLTWRRELFEGSQLLAEFPQRDDTTYLHRLDEQNPRAWLVNQVQQADDAAALALLADHDFDLGAVALVDQDFQPAADARATDPPDFSVALASLTPGHYRIELASDTGGLLVLAENWMPGWEIENISCAGAACAEPETRLSGLSPWSVVRANLALIGVAVPHGDVAFDLAYRPQSMRVGLLIAGVAALLLLMLIAWHAWVRSRRVET